MSRAALGLAAACAALSGCAQRSAQAAAPPAPPSAVLFVSADVRGYLGPCGCSENMRGGVERAAFQVLQARQEAKKAGAQVLYLDSGDSLFPRPQLTDAERPGEERKAQALAQAMKLMGLSVRARGELDDAGGAAFREALGLPEGVDGAARLFSLAGHPVAAVSAQNPAELKKGALEARARGAEFVVGLLHASFDDAQKVDAAVDLVVASHAATALQGEESRLVKGLVPVAELQSKGRALLRLDLTFGGAGAFELLKTQADAFRELSALDERIALLKKQIDAPSLKPDLKALYQGKLVEVVQRRETLAAAPLPSPQGKNAFAARFVPLEATLPESPEAKALVARYDRDVAALNLAWAKEHGQDCPKPKEGEQGYVGNEACRDCHKEAFPVWDGSKHAHAYADLTRVGKNYRLDCVKCHVVGYQSPGGVCRIDHVEGRKDVGCEACHGPGALHLEDPKNENVVRKPGKELCLGCHDPENSPHFDWTTYLKEIVGPGHGPKEVQGPRNGSSDGRR